MALDDIVREFEGDCVARIQTKLRSEREGSDSNNISIPSPTFLMFGIVIGVAASRVACTCPFIPGKPG